MTIARRAKYLFKGHIMVYIYRTTRLEHCTDLFAIDCSAFQKKLLATLKFENLSLALFKHVSRPSELVLINSKYIWAPYTSSRHKSLTLRSKVDIQYQCDSHCGTI